MKVIIRVDASVDIGTGHVIRCLTLAMHLKIKGADVCFVTKKHVGNIDQLIEFKGFEVYSLAVVALNQEQIGLIEPESSEALGGTSQDDALETINIIQSYFDGLVDWVIVDHYGLDRQWETELRRYCRHLMVIDDLDNRPHHCDLLLDQNCTFDTERYIKHIPRECQTLIGPSYSLLREEFLLAQQEHLEQLLKEPEKKVMIFFGGSDKYNETLKVLKGVLPFFNDVLFDVIIGKSNPHIEIVSAFCQLFSNVTLNVQVNDMAKRMFNATLFIGAGGATSLERAFCGLPSIVTSIALNQVESSLAFASKGVHVYLGLAQNLTEDDYKTALSILIYNEQTRFDMKKACESLVDGFGVSRVVSKIIEISNEDRI